MSDNRAPILDAAALRRAFDRSFAAPLDGETRDTVDLVAIRVGEDPYALRMSDIAELHMDVKTTPCPGPLAELLGIAGFRGALVPVYDLAALLGSVPSGRSWTVMSRNRQVAFAFTGFEGQLRLDPTTITRNASDDAAESRASILEIARHNGRVWPIIEIPSLVAAIRMRLPSALASKE